MKSKFLIISIGMLIGLSSCNQDESLEASKLSNKKITNTSQHNLALNSVEKENDYTLENSQNTPIVDYFLPLDGALDQITQNAVEIEYQKELDASYSGELALKGKPYTIIKSKGLKLYRWNCKEGDQHGWTNTRSAARTSAKAACNGHFVIEEIDIEAQIAISINSLSVFEDQNTEEQENLEASYLTYSENSNSSGETTLKGKPFTITKTKGSRWYRWNCKGTGTYGWSNSRSHARKTAKAACSGDIIIEEVGLNSQVSASINELIKL